MTVLDVFLLASCAFVYVSYIFVGFKYHIHTLIGYLCCGITTAGTNKAASTSTTLNTRKLDEETENLHHERVPTELKKAIMQARLEKKLTQAQLAQMINEKPQIIQEYESGKAIPNQQIIGKLERALGAKLRGKK
ncbi:putative transcription factor Lambda-DB family [Lupinus albus]|uniref:Putative transcription factor Lambda-DB family n=1 Tax=Lupinus albus TaxID=3870 RepID=A0A6A4R3Z8_LUPAL|nr:putative transcription factor Lambda-DB family [Lupinus albus]